MSVCLCLCNVALYFMYFMYHFKLSFGFFVNEDHCSNMFEFKWNKFIENKYNKITTKFN